MLTLIITLFSIPPAHADLIVSALDPAWRQMMCWAGMAKFIKLGWEALAGWVHN